MMTQTLARQRRQLKVRDAGYMAGCKGLPLIVPDQYRSLSDRSCWEMGWRSGRNDLVAHKRSLEQVYKQMYKK